MSSIRLLVLLAIVIVAAHPVYPAVINQYNTEAAFLSAVGSNDAITFNELGSIGVYNSVDGLTIDGINFVGYYRERTDAPYLTQYDLQTVNNGLNSWDGWYLRGPQQSNSTSRIRVFLPSDVRYFGSQVMATNVGVPQTDTITVVLATGPQQYQVTTINSFSSTAFIGFQTDEAIAWVDFYSPAGGNNIVLDNFRFAAAPAGPGPDPGSDVPDAATFLLTASGIVLILYRNRRRPLVCRG